MFCVNCGTKINDGDKFCTNCGTPVGKVDVNINQTSENANDDFASKIKNIKCVNEYEDNIPTSNMLSIKFGSYIQSGDKNANKTPLEWVVLEKDEKSGKALLLCKYSLYSDSYDENYRDFSGYEYVNWEECPVRKRLNENFINIAFNKDEQKKIADTNVVNNGYDEYTNRDGKDTIDKIFLLSFNEAKKYFKSNIQRTCVPAYDKNNKRGWWVRTTHDGISRGINEDGSLSIGEFTPYFSFEVRPALWVIYDEFKYKGNLNNNNKSEGKPKDKNTEDNLVDEVVKEIFDEDVCDSKLDLEKFAEKYDNKLVILNERINAISNYKYNFKYNNKAIDNKITISGTMKDYKIGVYFDLLQKKDNKYYVKLKIARDNDDGLLKKTFGGFAGKYFNIPKFNDASISYNEVQVDISAEKAGENICDIILTDATEIIKRMNALN